ncbi:MAG TPA: VOC family protein [Patescibacteria group bacterium]|nr:VOC family protein [Patescibacteria group bacterium]
MQRKEFLKGLVATAALAAFSGFASKATNFYPNNQTKNMKQELATFGAVHLNVTNLQRSILFWKENIGMKVRNTTAEYTEMGTDKSTLVVLYPTAKTAFKNGYSGLYHLAVHPSNEGEFARVLARLIQKGYPISPTDHTMSKAIYMTDPDGITVEITLETPERLDRMEISSNGIMAIDRDGTVRSPSAPLDVQSILKALPDNDVNRTLADDTKIGHMHLYVSDLEAANNFYLQLGFLQNTSLPQFGMYDLGAGGAFGHRIAFNSWHSKNKPQAPEGTAGMRFYTIIFDTQERLNAALKSFPSAEKQNDGYLVSDPAGNKILLTA